MTTYKQALAGGEQRYYTGEPCSYGHVSERYVKGRACIVCLRERQANREGRTQVSPPRVGRPSPFRDPDMMESLRLVAPTLSIPALARVFGTAHGSVGRALRSLDVKSGGVTHLRRTEPRPNVPPPVPYGVWTLPALPCLGASHPERWA